MTSQATPVTEDTTPVFGSGGGPPATDRQKIERLHAIAAEMMACRTEREVYQLTVAAAERVLAFDICGIDAVEDGWLVPKAVSTEMADVGYDRADVAEGGLAGRAHREGESIVVEDVREAGDADPADDQYRSVLTVPVGDLGVFQAGSTEVGAFAEADRELAELLLAHTEEALRRIRFETALRERNHTIEQLHETAAELVACEDEAAVYDLVVSAAEEVLDFRVCVVLVAEAGSEGLEIVAATDDEYAPDPGARIEPGQDSVAWRTFDRGSAAVVDDVHADEHSSPHHDAYASAISVPLGDVGVLQAIATETGAYDEEDRELAELLGSQAGAVLSRLRADERRADEHERLSALFENIPEPAVSARFDDGDVVVAAVNPAFESVFGYNAETAIGTPVDDLVVPDGEDETAREANRSARRGESFHFEAERETADGERRDFLVHVVPVERSPGNAGAFGIYTDITARKRREQRLGALHESARELMAADDLDAVCECAVDAASETLGLPVCGVHLREGDSLVPVAWTGTAGELFDGPPPSFEPGTGIWATFEDGGQRVFEDVSVDRPGEVAAVGSIMVVPLGEHGVFVAAVESAGGFAEQAVDLAGVLAATVETALDRTERERVLRERERELQRQNERLEEFASVVSHDLRNPLSVARGNLSLARETGDEEYHEKVERAHERMEALIEDLLALARGGQVTGEPGPVDLGEAAHRAWANVEAPSAELAVAGEATVVADADRLVQLLENLFRNAVEHGSTSPQQAEDAVEHGSTSPQGAGDAVEPGSTTPQHAGDAGEHAGADVAVTVEPTAAGFAVADDGPGIPEGDRETVLEYGYTTDQDGTGLGLAIVREIVEAHGWTISVGESEAGGARFAVETR